MSDTREPGAAAPEQAFWTHAQQLEKQPPCQIQCANSGDIRGWLGIIAQHEKIGLSLDEAYDQAWEKLTGFNPLPATIGRICPHPCEDHCTRSDKDGAVSVNAMERFAEVGFGTLFGVYRRNRFGPGQCVIRLSDGPSWLPRHCV